MNAPFDQLQTGIWYLLAGVIIGFAGSTLWEWLYFRRKRIQPRLDPYTLSQSSQPSRQAEVLPTDEARSISAVGGARMDIETPGLNNAQAMQTSGVAAVIAEAAPSPLPVEAAQPASPAHNQRSRGHPDDLTQIPGIDRAAQARLYRANIFTWHHVATSDVEVLRQVAEPPAGIAVEKWPAHARLLAEQNGRKNASYSGPPPEDLTRLANITPQQMNLLYKVGICTANQLAATSRSDLETLFANSPGSPFDYAGWLSAARRAAG